MNTIQAITELIFAQTHMEPCDLAIVLGNDYLGTMDHVHALVQNGMIKHKIILSGHSASGNKDLVSEAERFFRYGIELGIPEDMMLQETESTNTYENLEFSKVLISEKLGGFDQFSSIMFVAKAFVCRRVLMTAKALKYPDLPWILFPTVDTDGKNIARDSWWQRPESTERVLQELARIAKYSLDHSLAL